VLDQQIQSNTLFSQDTGKLKEGLIIIEWSFIIASMRVRDDNKKEAIFEATIELLNEIGFANITMSKIGKRAGVSSSTIYVYFENKEDMLKKVYIDVKKKSNLAMIQGIQQDFPARRVVERLVRNVVSFVQENRKYFLFIEQFSNSPIVEDLCQEDLDSIFGPLKDIIANCVKKGELRQASPSVLITYCHLPVAQVANTSLKQGAPLSEDIIHLIIEMSWNAVKA
jgi:AcrR family transcriptional regulator